MTLFNKTQPVASVKWVHYTEIQANDYNPNSVAPPEMKLLAVSILEDGWTQPIVTVWDAEHKKYIVVDGFHRYRTIKENKQVQILTDGFAPIVVLEKPIEERMLSTIRHNRARGKHSVSPMSSIVVKLSKSGMDDQEICQRLGMEMDEVLRLKQQSGLAAVFAKNEFSQAWE